MNIKWLKRDNEASLVVFFNGWGMDEAAVAHLDASGVDVLMLNDYRELGTLNEDISAYNKQYVVAWSMGVWAASRLLTEGKLRPALAIALNGTAFPMDDREGIPSLVLKRTQEKWSVDARERFCRRMMGSAALYKNNKEQCGVRSIGNQQQELDGIMRLLSMDRTETMIFDVAVIGQRDTAFPFENQLRYWENRARIVLVDMPHYPFLYFLSWMQIISI